MTIEKARYWAENMTELSKNDRLWLNNPVIMQGLGLAPLVVAATSLKNAVILSLAVLLLLTPTRILAALLSKFSYFRFRGLTYAFSAALVYAGVRWCVGQVFPATDIAPLGLYLPLLAADPIILKRYERPQRERVGTALRKGIITSLPVRSNGKDWEIVQGLDINEFSKGKIEASNQELLDEQKAVQDIFAHKEKLSQ